MTVKGLRKKVFRGRFHVKPPAESARFTIAVASVRRSVPGDPLPASAEGVVRRAGRYGRPVRRPGLRRH